MRRTFNEFNFALTVGCALLFSFTCLHSAKARDPQAAVVPTQTSEQATSRWDEVELWAQRKRPRTRAQRRRAARARKARAAEQKQSDKDEASQEPSDQDTNEADGSATGALLNSESTTEATGRSMGEGQSLQRSNEMQFDDRLIRGEKAGSGAVILFDRRARRLPRLTRDRKNFFEQTVRTVFGRDER